MLCKGCLIKIKRILDVSIIMCKIVTLWMLVCCIESRCKLFYQCTVIVDFRSPIEVPHLLPFAQCHEQLFPNFILKNVRLYYQHNRLLQLLHQYLSVTDDCVLSPLYDSCLVLCVSCVMTALT